MLFPLIGQHLDSLYHVVRHELGYLKAMDDLPPDEPTPEDVVDAVLPRAYQEFLKDPPAGRKIKSRLIELAREHLHAEVERLKAWRRRTPVRLEANVPDTPPTEWVSTLGDETLDFHEPDEDLKVEDVIPDLEVPTPEEETETRELQSCVDVALAGMPRQWRRALLLRHVEGVSGANLAKAIGRPEPETERILAHASEYLRQRLVESGCGLKGRDSQV
jgi:DNA-directed RNA polymerase specialized sigma24 family protein